jgi:hypothetical protein
MIDDTKHTDQLKRIQERSIQRRQEKLQQIHDLDLDLARVTATLAQATMQRQETNKNILSDSVYRPLEQMVERLSLERETSSTQYTASVARPQNQWMHLESKLSQIQSQMIHNLQVSTTDKQKSLFETIERDLSVCIVPLLEQQKEKKQSRMVDSKIEQVAGMLKRQLLEEKAARKTAIDVSTETLKNRQELDEKRGQEYLSQIQELRRTLTLERLERQRQDDLTQQQIHLAASLLQEALLGSVDDDHEHDEPYLQLTES